jgi:hypothetical protein
VRWGGGERETGKFSMPLARSEKAQKSPKIYKGPAPYVDTYIYSLHSQAVPRITHRGNLIRIQRKAYACKKSKSAPRHSRVPSVPPRHSRVPSVPPRHSRVPSVAPHQDVMTGRSDIRHSSLTNLKSPFLRIAAKTSYLSRALDANQWQAPWLKPLTGPSAPIVLLLESGLATTTDGATCPDCTFIGKLHGKVPREASPSRRWTLNSGSSSSLPADKSHCDVS